MTAHDRCKMPEQTTNRDGQERKVGVEIELSGLTYEALVQHAARLLGASRS